MTKILLSGDIDVNCYIIEAADQCYIIDPGFQREKIINYVKQHDLQVLGILLTHGHFDHVGALDCFNVPIYIHQLEYELLIDDNKNGFGVYGKKMNYELGELLLERIDESQVFELADKRIEVLHTPGHTAGSVCYKIDQELYTGDTLFKEGVGRWDFPTGNLALLQKSVVNLIEKQPENTIIFPGHGEKSTILNEKQHNKFYLSWR